MQHLKAFIGVALVIAIIGTIMSAAIPVPVSIGVIFLNGLIVGAMISGLSVFFRNTLLRSQTSDQGAYAIAGALGALLLFVVFAITGTNDGSLVAAFASVAFSAVSGFIGSFAMRIGGR